MRSLSGCRGAGFHSTHRSFASLTPMASRGKQRSGPHGAARVRLGYETALYISGEAFAMRADRMQEAGIQRIVSLGCKPHHPDRFLYHELHVADSANAKVGPLLRPAATFIARGLAAGEGVLVHCKAGICRSATIIVAYLLIHRRDLAPSLERALALLRESRPAARPRPEFMLALARLDAQMQREADVAREGGDHEEEDAEPTALVDPAADEAARAEPDAAVGEEAAAQAAPREGGAPHPSARAMLREVQREQLPERGGKPQRSARRKKRRGVAMHE